MAGCTLTNPEKPETTPDTAPQTTESLPAESQPSSETHSEKGSKPVPTLPDHTTEPIDASQKASLEEIIRESSRMAAEIASRQEAAQSIDSDYWKWFGRNMEINTLVNWAETNGGTDTIVVYSAVRDGEESTAKVIDGLGTFLGKTWSNEPARIRVIKVNNSDAPDPASVYLEIVYLEYREGLYHIIAFQQTADGETTETEERTYPYMLNQTIDASVPNQFDTNTYDKQVVYFLSDKADADYAAIQTALFSSDPAAITNLPEYCVVANLLFVKEGQSGPASDDSNVSLYEPSMKPDQTAVMRADTYTFWPADGRNGNLYADGKGPESPYVSREEGNWLLDRAGKRILGPGSTAFDLSSLNDPQAMWILSETDATGEISESVVYVLDNDAVYRAAVNDLYEHGSAGFRKLAFPEGTKVSDIRDIVRGYIYLAALP